MLFICNFFFIIGYLGIFVVVVAVSTWFDPRQETIQYKTISNILWRFLIISYCYLPELLLIEQLPTRIRTYTHTTHEHVYTRTRIKEFGLDDDDDGDDDITKKKNYNAKYTFTFDLLLHVSCVHLLLTKNEGEMWNLV